MDITNIAQPIVDTSFTFDVVVEDTGSNLTSNVG